MSLAAGVTFMTWTAARFGDLEPARCLVHVDEPSPALREFLDQSVPLLDVQHANAISGVLTPTALVDLSQRADVIDLKRVAKLDAAGRLSYEYVWHQIYGGYVRFAVLDLRIRRPARAQLTVAFPMEIPQVRQLLDAAATTGWMTIGSADGEFVLPMIGLGAGLAETLGAGEGA